MSEFLRRELKKGILNIELRRHVQKFKHTHQRKRNFFSNFSGCSARKRVFSKNQDAPR